MTKHIIHRLSLLLLLLLHIATAHALSVTAVADADVEHAYLNNVASGSTATTKSNVTTISLSTYYAKILTDLGLTESASGQQLYIRWYIENSDGTLADINGKLTPATAGKGHVTDTQCLYWCSALSSVPFAAANKAAILDLRYENAGTVGQKVVALIAKMGDDNPLTTADGAVTAEPAHFQLKYSFRLVDQTNAGECYITTSANLPVPQYVSYYDSSINTLTLKVLDKDASNTFTRFYLVDRSTGGIIKDSQDCFNYTTDNWASIGTFYNTPYGMTVYTRSSASSKPGTLRITLPKGKSLKDISIVKLQGGISGLVAGNVNHVNNLYTDYFVAQDPTTFTSMTVYSYPTPADFDVDAVPDVDVTTVCKRLVASGKTANPSSDITTLPLGDYYTKILSDLGLKENAKGQPLYIRWYIENADGTLADPEGKLTAANASGGHVTLSKGLYWYAPMSSLPFTSGNSANILNVKYGNAGAKDKKIVALVAKIDDTNPLTFTNGAITADPPHFQLKYTFSIVDKDDAQTAYVCTTTLPALTQDIPSWSPTATAFDIATLSGNSSERFMRIYLKDRATGNMIENSTDYMSYNTDGDKKGCFYRTPYGMTIYTRSTASFYPGNLHITLPEGKTFNDIAVVVLYSDNTRGVAAGNFVKNTSNLYPDFYVAQDPATWTSYTEYVLNFQHSSGYAYNYAPEGLKDGRQQVAQWTYNYYVKPGEKRKLFVPVYKHEGDGNEQEPNAYWRWYDYGTDRGCTYLLTDANVGNTLSTLMSNDNQNYGLFRYKMQTAKPCDKNVSAVWFNTPADDAGWTGTDVAWDVSRYVDGQGFSTDILYEPTLSMRYIFKVRPASEIADNIKDALLSGKAYEDNGYMTFGLYSGYEGNMTLRLNIKDLSMYYFYPYNNRDFGKKAQEGDFEANICQGQTVTWAAITRIGHKYYYHILTQKNGQEATLLTNNYIDINKDSFVGNYVSLASDQSSETSETKTLSSINIGRAYHVVAFINDYKTSGTANGHSTPVAAYNIYFRALSAPQDINNLDYNRSDSILEANYTKVADISFDDEEDMNYDKPDKPFVKGYGRSNQWDKPVDWSLSNYSFTYPGLRDYSYYCHSFGAGQYFITPLHSDYAIIKSMNDPAASANNASAGYYWYTSSLLYDVTYYKSGHTKYGYFAYVDASDESRPVISASFDANLCEGSTVVATIYIANVTNAGNQNNSYPQLVFKIYGESVNQSTGQTERQLIQSFASGDFKSVGATQTGQWYQIFATAVLAAGTHPEKYSHFIITIDNQCASTQGNDFAIDDIRIYVKNPKIEVLQQSDDADLCKNRENGAKLKLSMVYSQVKDALELPDNDDPATDDVRPLFWRLVHADTGQPVSVEYGDSSYNAGHTYEYGAIAVHSTDTLNRRNLYVDNSEYYHLILANKFFKLDPLKQYYVSVATPLRRIVNGVEVYQPSSWGTPNATCSIYSSAQDYVQQDAVITDENGSVNTTFSAECGATSVMVNIKGKLSLPDAVNGGRLEVARCPFDWFSGSNDEFNAVSGLNTALANFRSVYPTDTTLQPTSGAYTKADSTLLATYVKGVTSNESPYEHKLYLLASNTFKAPFALPEDADRIIKITMLPIAGQYTDTRTVPAQTFTICGYPLETSATLTHDGPVLNLGFASVTYPDDWTHTARYLRLGLKQLEALEGADTYLRIPINSYTDAQRPITANPHNLQIITRNAASAPAQLILSATNDPLNTANIGKSFGIVQNATIQPATKNLAFNLAPAKAAGIELHEGYDYTLELQYHDATQDIASANTCKGTTHITLQVVPEYVTWSNNLANNDNWNNDGNWRRATKSELYNPDYKDYGTDVPGLQQAAGSDAATTPQAYIPMRFTKVIVPNGVEPPFLGTYTVSTRDSLLTYLGNAVNAPATDNIAYYLMLKTAPATSGSYTYYDCERFYANTCDQVYFKPRAELRYQQYLQYNQAWVDVEMQPGEWTMWSSPLKSVYAGDFYVPQATGRQQSVVFTPITYDATVNSRAGYPIYQRSWDKTQSMVITDTDDALRNDYDAYIDYDSFSGTDTLAVMQQWSSRYNDVTQPYAPGQGAALLSEDGAHTGQATLVRLPKADTQYAYYRADGTERQSVTLPARTGQGQLATSDPAVTDPQKLTGRLVISIDEANAHADNGYYLVGNPYMASLYMKRFFAQNTQLYPKYWTMEDGQMQAYDASADNAVPPMTAFFVKPVSGTLLQSIEFTPIMMVPYTSAVTQSAQATLQLTLSSGSRTASARIVADKGADADFKDGEDVEAMFDSNTTGTAPTLYTMAGQLAAAINHVPDLRNVPLGIMAPDTTTAVTLRIAGTDQLGKPLYLYDAHTKHYTLLTDSTAVVLTPNAVGRYALTSEAIAPQPVQTALRCWASAGGKVTATTAPDDCLRSVLVFDPSGRLVRELQPAAVAFSFKLPAGPYLITVCSDAVSEGRTFKVAVGN